MNPNSENLAVNSTASSKHPKGLYALFAIEMWERFSFYSMLALFALYLRDPKEGFGWTATQATSLYANYLMFVYASPLIGGLIADKITGYRKAVMIGGVFFILGHGLLSIPALWAVYAALTCLVIGNGFFKPNVSTMVGNLYAAGSPLRDRAYNIFYMGINVGAWFAPVIMEIVKKYHGFHVAFAIAAFGMVISVGTLWYFRNIVESAESVKNHGKDIAVGDRTIIDSVPDWKRVGALIVVFLIVIVFWMVFHQNGSTLTYWADDNTNWNVSGIISNSINPFWIIVLTFPLIWFWEFLARRGKEPSTPSKMAIGMLLTAISFFVLYFAATIGEAKKPTPEDLAVGSFRINERIVKNLVADGVPQELLDQVMAAKGEDGKNLVNDVKFSATETDGVKISGGQSLIERIDSIVPGEGTRYQDKILTKSYLFRVSAFWLLLAYAIISLGELMLSPMGLSLVSKVAPVKMRGVMMGGWFAATAIGNKLTMIGIYWSIWNQSSFFVVLGGMALVMAVVLLVLIKPLKKAMPGV
jgi:POT family proton-dependent oligopeptide transporter